MTEPDIRYLIRHKPTGRYYSGPSGWTEFGRVYNNGNIVQTLNGLRPFSFDEGEPKCDKDIEVVCVDVQPVLTPVSQEKFLDSRRLKAKWRKING